MLDNLEKLEKVIFQGGTFSVKNTITLGAKNAAGNRLNPIYKRSYNSTKYNDRNSLDTIKFQASEFIVFAVNDFENKINEEVYISYPHMPDLLGFLDDCYTVMSDPNSFPNGQPNMEIVIESEPFAMGKKLMAVPAIWDGRNNDIRKGLLLFLDSEEVCTKLEANAIATLCYCMSNYNLASESNQLIIMGMLSELGAGGVSTNGHVGGAASGATSAFTGRNASTSTFGSGNSKFGSGSKTNNKRGLYSNANGANKTGLGGKANTPENLPTEDTSSAAQDSATVDPKPSTAPKSGKRLSMGNVIKAAAEIEDLGEVEI